jgi:hypothetical protein
MADCPLLHIFQRTEGGGVFSEIFIYDYDTLTLSITGFDPSHLGKHSFYVRASLNNGVDQYRYDDYPMDVFIVEAPTVFTFSPASMV